MLQSVLSRNCWIIIMAWRIPERKWRTIQNTPVKVMPNHLSWLSLAFWSTLVFSRASLILRYIFSEIIICDDRYYTIMTKTATCVLLFIIFFQTSISTDFIDETLSCVSIRESGMLVTFITKEQKQRWHECWSYIAHSWTHVLAFPITEQQHPVTVVIIERNMLIEAFCGQFVRDRSNNR